MKEIKLKISDLLRNIGKDEISFNEDGISGILELNALDGKGVFVIVKNFSTVRPTVCDRCWEMFHKSVFVESYSAKYTLDTKELENSNEDVIFAIDPKNETIDLSELFFQVSHSDDPFVEECTSCKMQNANTEKQD